MKTFTIPVTYQMGGEYKVEADTLQDAIDLVNNAEPPYESLPEGAEYVDDSMEIDRDVLKEQNPEDYSRDLDL